MTTNSKVKSGIQLVRSDLDQLLKTITMELIVFCWCLIFLIRNLMIVFKTGLTNSINFLVLTPLEYLLEISLI